MGYALRVEKKRIEDMISSVGDILQRRPDYNEATSALKRLQLERSSVLDGLFNNGTETLEKDPCDLNSLLLLADVKKELGDYTEARNYLERCLKLDPNSERVSLQLKEL